MKKVKEDRRDEMGKNVKEDCKGGMGKKNLYYTFSISFACHKLLENSFK